MRSNDDKVEETPGKQNREVIIEKKHHVP